jgi:hypothetical protein
VTTAQVAQDKESVKSEILQRLHLSGGVVVAETGTMKEIQHKLGLRCSGRTFRRAAGSLITERRLQRHRRAQASLYETERPMVIRLPFDPVTDVKGRGSFAR